MGILSGLVAIIPYIGTIVQGVETLFGSGNGTTKKNAALAMAGAGLNIYGTASNDANVANATNQAAFMTALGNLIDDVVAVYNAVGVFEHGTPNTSSTKS